ncbi:hypothetical protein [Actinokineospora iranica]|uniref:Uncharacterized protein n=1 Tax=Actinokineospora iranica TaxID=1271860 RepID=A0A1G6UD85_9PSEU|nr:hypothetical protein [Actinokineospora iranica]SDD39194.1 hypothetical protein SAMN05216174_110215 [Actinokineospora iranica]
MTSAIQGLRLELPPGFAALPIGENAAAQRDHAFELVRKAESAGQDVGDAVTTAEQMVGVFDALRAMDIQLCGKFAVVTDDAPATATVLLSVQRLRSADPAAAAGDLVGMTGAVKELFQRRNPQAQTRTIQLPIGHAVAALVVGEFRIPPERFGAEDELVIPTFRAVFLIPLTTGDHLAALDVSTTSEAGWPEISRQAVAIARSLRYGRDDR